MGVSRGRGAGLSGPAAATKQQALAGPQDRSHGMNLPRIGIPVRLRRSVDSGWVGRWGGQMVPRVGVMAGTGPACTAGFSASRWVTRIPLGHIGRSQRAGCGSPSRKQPDQRKAAMRRLGRAHTLGEQVTEVVAVAPDRRGELRPATAPRTGVTPMASGRRGLDYGGGRPEAPPRARPMEGEYLPDHRGRSYAWPERLPAPGRGRGSSCGPGRSGGSWWRPAPVHQGWQQIAGLSADRRSCQYFAPLGPFRSTDNPADSPTTLQSAPLSANRQPGPTRDPPGPQGAHSLCRGFCRISLGQAHPAGPDRRISAGRMRVTQQKTTDPAKNRRTRGTF